MMSITITGTKKDKKHSENADTSTSVNCEPQFRGGVKKSCIYRNNVHL